MKLEEIEKELKKALERIEQLEKRPQQQHHHFYQPSSAPQPPRNPWEPPQFYC